MIITQGGRPFMGFAFPSNKLLLLSHSNNNITRRLSYHQQQIKRRERGICRAVELNQEAPFVMAIGASMLNTLFFTHPPSEDDDDEEAAISTTDARFAVMTIISFIPFFNWLSWVFAAMDTGKPRYAVYAVVYLAPYLRTNLSLSPDESWLPIASILLCILHIQLEASTRSGDLDALNFFSDVKERLGLVTRRKGHSKSLGKNLDKKESTQIHVNLSSGKHESREEIGKWRVPTKLSEDPQNVDEDGDPDDRTKH